MDINQNLKDLMKEAQKMQQRMQEAQEQLSKLMVSGEAGGGMVKVEMNGRHDVTKVYISPALKEEETEMLEDLIAAAFNDAVRKVEKASKEKISQLTSGLNLPTGFMKEDEDKK
ncbi:YbaB/EbfC family nucleoid-associated protein [Legionella londiniensis]|uniref:Nucleoid-associated protein Llon_0238 n=1 Tax=Legionella londiniensis TaxID=45068 RepID=A0A0W0VU12_9GAMM|nr:YbaB/EbfC family nucleoid-associated protein [Legionella londiniensis]KTD23353.1 Nucleoid-associated protein YbaB [Legionella londiniensis]STX94092.1 DNA-binding protein, YbaB/EbfC family [Legionella londiniensis]